MAGSTLNLDPSFLTDCVCVQGGADDGAFFAPAIFVPAGNYIISGQINTTNSALIDEGGNTMIRQLNPNSPIFVNPSVWRWRLQSISLVG